MFFVNDKSIKEILNNFLPFRSCREIVIIDDIIGDGVCLLDSIRRPPSVSQQPIDSAPVTEPALAKLVKFTLLLRAATGRAAIAHSAIVVNGYTSKASCFRRLSIV